MNIKSERGFALPMTIMLVALLTVMLSAALARAGTDEQITVGIENYVRAQAIAQTGLERYLDNLVAIPPDGDTDTISSGIVDGYAIVTAHQVSRPADSTMKTWYVVESTGYVVVASAGPDPQASRTIGQMAYWQNVTLDQSNLPAAITAPSGVSTMSVPAWWTTRINGSSFAYCGTSTIAGAAVDSGNAVPSSVVGAPAVVQYDYDSAGPGFAPPLQSVVGLDSDALMNGRFNYNSTSLNYVNWDDVYYIDGNWSTFALFGSGILVVTGNLNISLFGDWEGVVIVGGRLVLGQHAKIDGAVFVGVKEFLGQAQSSSQVNGEVRYDPCAIDDATSLLDGMIPVQNAWIDHWATY